MKDLMEYRKVTDSLAVFYSTSQDGNMSSKFGDEAEVLRNKCAFFDSLGMDLKNTCCFKVSNSDAIYEFTYKDIPDDKDISRLELTTDAILTNTRDVFFYLAFGDCIPFVLFDTRRDILGFVHLSWFSICKKLHQKILAKLVKEYNSKPDDLICLFGPSIRADSYCFSAPDQLGMPEWKNYIYKNKNGLYAVDLIKFVVDDILSLNFSEENIYCSQVDTGSDDNFYSHFRSVNDKSWEEGRFIFGGKLS